MKLKVLLMALAFCGPLFGEGEEMVVHLSTESELLPLYASRFSSSETAHSPAYIAKLEEVMRFDLANSGKIALLNVSAAVDQLAASAPFNAEKWKQAGAFYHVKTQVFGNQLTATLVSVQGNWVKKAGPVVLSGDLSRDRRLLHEVSDAINRALFGSDGIAGTRILYTVKRENKEWESDIWEVDYDGANGRRILTDVGYCVTPQYAVPAAGHGAGSLFFVSYKTGQPKIYTASRDGSGIQRFSYLRGNQLMPTMSPTRDTVAFISDASGNPDLFIQDFSPDTGAVGKPRQIYASSTAAQGTPTFSPDGKRLAFVSNKDGSPRIYEMKIPPPGVKSTEIKTRLITKFHRGCTAPSWSPDGLKIAYCARIDGVRQIIVHELKTGQDRQITQGPVNKENPTWAPNSFHLVYNGDNNLYIVNLNQLKSIRITQGPGEKRFPHWELRQP